MAYDSLDSDFCVRALLDALDRGRPQVFHTDQGCQFTSKAFTCELHERGIQISMSGRARCYDNVFIERFWRSPKTEEIYKNEYTTGQLRRAVEEYFISTIQTDLTKPWAT